MPKHSFMVIFSRVKNDAVEKLHGIKTKGALKNAMIDYQFFMMIGDRLKPVSVKV